MDGLNPLALLRRTFIHPTHTALVVGWIVVLKPPLGALMWHHRLRGIGVIRLRFVIPLPNCPLRDIRGCGWCGLRLVIPLPKCPLRDIHGCGWCVLLLLKVVMSLVVCGIVLILIIQVFMAVGLRIVNGMLFTVGSHMCLSMCWSIVARTLPIVHHLGGLTVVHGLRGTVDNGFVCVHCEIEDK